MAYRFSLSNSLPCVADQASVPPSKDNAGRRASLAILPDTVHLPFESVAVRRMVFEPLALTHAIVLFVVTIPVPETGRAEFDRLVAGADPSSA